LLRPTHADRRPVTTLIAVLVLYSRMDKFTLFELHVHDGMEFSATNTAPAIGDWVSDDTVEELEEYVDAGDGDEAEASDSEGGASGGRSLLPLLVGVVALATVVVAVRKLRGGDADLEIAELDDMTDDEGMHDVDAEH
jgi:hypothetical protein